MGIEACNPGLWGGGGGAGYRSAWRIFPNCAQLFLYRQLETHPRLVAIDEDLMRDVLLAMSAQILLT